MTEGPERTEDGRYIIVNGRKWRASDPSIPENLEKQLVSALMRGRRLVKDLGDPARCVVGDAKVALGERGDKWWEPTEEGQRKRVAAAILTLARARGYDSSLCPSDAARITGGQSWRELMDTCREVAEELRQEGLVKITQKGEEVSHAGVAGPIRITAGEKLEFVAED